MSECSTVLPFRPPSQLTSQLLLDLRWGSELGVAVEGDRQGAKDETRELHAMILTGLRKTLLFVTPSTLEPDSGTFSIVTGCHTGLPCGQSGVFCGHAEVAP